jgi:hypothetical protein
VNDEALNIITPNPSLLPERSERVAASLSYFFGKTGINNVQVVASRTKVKNQTTGATLSSEEYGNTDPQYDSYTFTSFTNITSPVIYNSMEYSYQQYLSFLPRLFQGTFVNLSYTRTYYETSPGAPSSGRLWGVEPHTVKGTLGWRYGRVNISFSGIWVDDTNFLFGTLNRYRKANTKCDLSASVRLTDHFSLYLAGRNIFQQPHRIMEFSAGNPDVLYRYENYGTNWTVGMRGNF